MLESLMRAPSSESSQTFADPNNALIATINPLNYDKEKMLESMWLSDNQDSPKYKQALLSKLMEEQENWDLYQKGMQANAIARPNVMQDTGEAQESSILDKQAREYGAKSYGDLDLQRKLKLFQAMENAKKETSGRYKYLD